MTVLIGISILALGAAAAALWRRCLERRKPTGGASAEKRGAARTARLSASGANRVNRFASVLMRAGRGACEAAKALDGRAFLVAEAPSLPLDACKAPRCGCSFAKRDDRRQDPRRWSDTGVQPILWSAAERRRGRGRRSEDGSSAP